MKPGDVYGSWTVVDIVGNRSILCQCRCGTLKTVDKHNLLRGQSTKCQSCYQPGLKLKLEKELYYRLRRCARNAIKRCTVPTARGYENYGGRGIKVYAPWVEDYHEFIKYLTTLGGHDNPALMLDRENNEGDYEPGNLRFVTSSISNKNKRKPINNGHKGLKRSPQAIANMKAGWTKRKANKEQGS